MRLDREKNPHLSFGLGDHRCIGSNLARLQIEIGTAEVLARIENIKLVEGTVLEREAGTGSGWTSLPVTFRARCEDLTLVTRDPRCQQYDVAILPA